MVKKFMLYATPVNSHFPEVWFSDFLARSDLEGARQVEAAG